MRDGQNFEIYSSLFSSLLLTVWKTNTKGRKQSEAIGPQPNWKRLRHRCFPVNSKFLRTPFLWKTFVGCFWKEFSDEILSIFWRNANMKKHFLKWINRKKFFVLLPAVFIFDFCKNMNPRLCILFLAHKSMT